LEIAVKAPVSPWVAISHLVFSGISSIVFAIETLPFLGYLSCVLLYPDSLFSGLAWLVIYTRAPLKAMLVFAVGASVAHCRMCAALVKLSEFRGVGIRASRVPGEY
jgi:hypothetical protein